MGNGRQIGMDKKINGQNWGKGKNTVEWKWEENFLLVEYCFREFIKLFVKIYLKCIHSIFILFRLLLLVFGNEIIPGQRGTWNKCFFNHQYPLKSLTQIMFFHELFQWEFCPCIIFGNLKTATSMLEKNNHITMFTSSGLGSRWTWKIYAKTSLNINIGWMEWTIGLLMLATIDPFDDIWGRNVHNKPMEPFSHGWILSWQIIRIYDWKFDGK